jgi:hypothetical protein
MARIDGGDEEIVGCGPAEQAEIHATPPLGASAGELWSAAACSGDESDSINAQLFDAQLRYDVLTGTCESRPFFQRSLVPIHYTCVSVSINNTVSTRSKCILSYSSKSPWSQL